MGEHVNGPERCAWQKRAELSRRLFTTLARQTRWSSTQGEQLRTASKRFSPNVLK